MGNFSCGNNEADVLEINKGNNVEEIPKEVHHFHHHYNHGGGGGGYNIDTEKPKLYTSRDVINMTPREAMALIKEKTVLWGDTDEKVFYLYVVKKDGELQQEVRIDNRRGLAVKTNGGKITKVYTEASIDSGRHVKSSRDIT